MGYSPKEASEFVRFSPGRNTTPEDIHHTVTVIRDIYRKRSGRL
jgi:cysteine sulfinate desulfinase/cysteine desulfurase-like protein